jgi:hypothetical protein
MSNPSKQSPFGLFAIVKQIVDAGRRFRSLAEPWADTATSTRRLMITVLGGLAGDRQGEGGASHDGSSFHEIDGKRYLWRELVRLRYELRQAAVEAEQNWRCSNFVRAAARWRLHRAGTLLPGAVPYGAVGRPSRGTGL